MDNIVNPTEKNNTSITREQLIQELRALRARVGELEATAAEHLQIAARLVDSDKRYRAVIENVSDAIVINVSNARAFVNKAFLTMHGLDDASQVLGLPLEQFVVPEDKQLIVERTLAQQDGTLVPQVYEYRILKSDGEVRTVETSAASISYGGMPATLEVLRDITDRTTKETALRDSEERWRSLAQNAPCVITNVDKDGICLFLNRSVPGFVVEEAPGRSIFENVDPSHIEPMKRVLDLAFQEGEVSEYEYEARTTSPDGSFLWYLNRLSPIKLNGNIEFATVVSIDITKQKEAEEYIKQNEERLQEASRLISLGELAAGAAHEINNPLAVVTGSAELLMDMDLPERAAGYAKRILLDGHRAAKIVQNLLSFARVRGSEKLYMDVTTVLQQALDLVAHELSLSNIRVVTDWAADLPHTMVDQQQLTQVLINVMTNAQQAMSQHRGSGELIVKAKHVDDKIRISVVDDGPGISSENLRKIFDPFFTTKQVGEGTGLGLSICFGIVREHGGDIWVESPTGQGATFHIDLPIIFGELERKDKPTDADLEGLSDQRILVVDDEAGIRDLLFENLSEDGHTVDLAPDGDSAFGLIQTNQYDCIIMDIRMPGTNGPILYQLVVEHDPCLIPS